LSVKRAITQTTVPSVSPWKESANASQRLGLAEEICAYREFQWIAKEGQKSSWTPHPGLWEVEKNATKYKEKQLRDYRREPGSGGTEGLERKATNTPKMGSSRKWPDLTPKNQTADKENRSARGQKE